MELTPKLLCAALEKYVFRNKFTQKDKEYVLNQSEDVENFEPEKTLHYLIENSEKRLDIYAPANELMQNLEALIDFPNNSQFLGICGMNFDDTYRSFKDSKDLPFILKSEIPLFLYEKLEPNHADDDISILLLEAYADKFYQKLKNTLEYIPENIVQDMYKEVSEYVNNSISSCAGKPNKISYNFVKYTHEEVFSTLSKFYDNENDEEYLTVLREELEVTAKELPIRCNLDYYKKVLKGFKSVEKFMKYAMERFSYIFQQNPKIDKSFPHFRVIRVFELCKKKFLFVKDLECALNNYENVKIDVETTEERKNGIVLTMEYEKFENILKQAGISENDINIIPIEFEETKHDVNPPILTSYGTHCKLACDAFREVFRVFSIEISWFNTVSEKNYFKMTNWFNSLSDVFSDSQDELYCIEVWKIEELKNQVYEKFKKYTRKPKYDPPSSVRFLTKEQMYEEIEKFGTNMKLKDESWRTVWLITQTGATMSKWDVLVMYDHYCLFQFTLDSNKITKFILKHLDQKAIRNEHPSRETHSHSLIYQKAQVDDTNVTQLPKYYNKLDAHHIKFTNEYVYSMSTMDCDSFYENDTCLKLALDKTIGDETAKSKIISIVYEAEMKKFENQRRSVFFVTDSEFSSFWQMTKRKFDEIMQEIPAINFDSELWKIHFPIDEYSEKFHESVQEILRIYGNSEEMIIIALKAREIFEECSEKIRSFKDYCRENKERTTVMRIMCETRVDDFKEWHMFSDEVLEAIEVVLENEGRLETMKEQIEKWRKKWIIGENFTTITVKLFKTIVDLVGINISNFEFLPDVHFFKEFIKVPLKMGYNAIKVLSPDGREVYHQTQAQFLIFQYGACDVVWNTDDKKAKNKHKKEILKEMRKIGKGYTLAEIVEESVKRVMYSDVAQKTALSALHGKYFDEPLTNKEICGFRKFSSSVNLNGFLAFQCKAYFLAFTLDKFEKNRNEEKELKRNLFKTITMLFGFMQMDDMEAFETLCEIGLEKGFSASTFYTMKVFLDINVGYHNDDSIECANCGCGCGDSDDEEESEEENYAMAKMQNVISITNLKNESARTTYDEKELIDQHYLFDESDPLGTLAKEKKGNLQNRKEEVKKDENVLVKLLNVIPKVMASLPNEDIQPIDKLWELFEDYIQKEYDEEEAIILCKTLRSDEGNDMVKMKLSEILDFTSPNGVEMFESKKMKEPGTKLNLKKEEDPKVVVKYVTETKIVENCVNCRSIEKETIRFKRRNEKLEKENEEYHRIVKKYEEDLAMLKSQISQNKMKYREEIQKHKVDVEGREAKIEQLNQEIKEYREDSRIERENLYAEVRKSSRKADEAVKKMKVELENSKFLETAKNKKIDELTAEISQLKTSLEISEENRTISERAKEAENRIRMLEKQIEEMAVCFEDSTFDEDFYSNSQMMVGDLDELLRFDVYGILDKISKISDIYGISKSEIIRFQRRYDMYIRIVENENCWETAEIPDFPIPFSMDFMQNYEMCLKEDFMFMFEDMAWSNCTYTQ